MKLTQLKSKQVKLLYVVVVLVLATGCSSGGTPIRYYLVDPQDYGVVSETSNLSIELVDLQVPQYLERFQIASRFGENQLVFSDMHQWGENLRKNLIRTMGVNLGRLLNTVDVGTPENRTASKPDYRVSVHIARFERDADGRVRLLARFQVISVASDRPIQSQGVELVSDRSFNSADYSGTVSSMSELFSVLGRRIATTITSLETSS